MSRPNLRATPPKRRVPGLLASLLAVCCWLPLAAWAVRPVRVYEVDLDKQSPTAVQDALRAALVRATGRREAAGDPAFASLIADAARLVQSYTAGPHGEPQVVFDGADVGRAIGAAGRSVWDRDRPFTLVVLYPPPDRAAAEAARAELERAATERGLPISVIPLTVVDDAGNTLASEALLQAAQRYGGDQVLIGRADAGASPGQFQWTLYTRVAAHNWTGPLAAGIDDTVDLLAPPAGAAQEELHAPTWVRIEGVNGLADYAAVERLLQSVPGMRRADVAQVESGSVSFEIELRGGAAALDRELAGSNRLVRSGTGAGRLVYRYQP